MTRALKSPSEADEMVAIADVAVKHVAAGLHPAPAVALTPDQRAKEMEKLSPPPTRPSRGAASRP